MSNSAIPVTVDDPLQLAWFECNDYGNGRRLEVLAAGLLKWVDDKAWVAFDGRRWSEREGGYRARALAHQVAAHIHDEAAALGALIDNPKSPDERALHDRFGSWCSGEIALDRLSMLHKHAIKSGNAAQTAAMLTQARDMAGMRAWSEEFDCDPLVYNCQNGTGRFALRDGVWRWEFRDGHEPAEMLRQISEFVYDSDATCPQWIARLEQVQPDTEQRGILPMLYGQTLTGLMDGEEFYTHQGEGGDGKSKTHEVLAKGHGDYYRHSPVKTWLSASFQKSGSEHRSDLVRLSGDIRFITSEEPPKNSTWDSEILKQWTGGGNITARGSGATTEITYKPRGKLNIEVNKLPSAPSDDRGWWRRQVIISWPVDTSTLPGGAEAPAELIARLSTEMSGIFNWLIAGACEWLSVRKIPKVSVMEAAIASARAGTSPIGEWLAERCDRSDKSAVELASRLYGDFKAWCEANGLDKVPTQTAFGRGLTDRQIYVGKDRTGKVTRKGVHLKDGAPLLGGGGGGNYPSDDEWAARSGGADADLDNFLGGGS